MHIPLPWYFEKVMAADVDYEEWWICLCCSCLNLGYIKGVRSASCSVFSHLLIFHYTFARFYLVLLYSIFSSLSRLQAYKYILREWYGQYELPHLHSGKRVSDDGLLSFRNDKKVSTRHTSIHIFQPPLHIRTSPSTNQLNRLNLTNNQRQRRGSPQIRGAQPSANY